MSHHASESGRVLIERLNFGGSESKFVPDEQTAGHMDTDVARAVHLPQGQLLKLHAFHARVQPDATLEVCLDPKGQS